MSEPNFIVGGSSATIAPSVFVNSDTTTSNGVIQAADATHFIMGVAQEWAAGAPIPGASTVAGSTGQPIKVYSIGDICLLQSTTAGWTAGDRLTANSSGQGITASTTNYYGAVALTTLSGAGLGRVQVILGKNP